MKICFLGYSEPDGKTFENGVVRVVYNMAQLFRAHGYKVCFYHLFSREEYKGLNQYLLDNDVDLAIWHMTSLKFRGLISTPCPLICLWHSTPFFSSKNYSSKFFALAHRMYNALAFTYLTGKANRLVVFSNGFKKDMLAWRFFPEKIIAIPNMNFEDSVEVAWEKKERRVAYVGRLRAEKQVDKLLDVWAGLGDHAIDWTLDICGDGPDREMLEQKCRDLELKNVIFHGYVDPKNVLDRASILCMSSRYEGWGLVLLEAAAHGCVPMAFDSYAAARDIINDGVNGVLIRPFEIHTYIDRLSDIMENMDKRQMMAKQAKIDVDRYAPERIMMQWIDLVKKIMTEG